MWPFTVCISFRAIPRAPGDTSAPARLIPDVADAHGWLDARRAGLASGCDLTELKLLYSARSAAGRTAETIARHTGRPTRMLGTPHGE